MEAFESAHKLTSQEIVRSRQSTASPDMKETWKQFDSSWRAVQSRYRTCTEHSGEFTRLLQEHGDGPTDQYRYEQDREIFEFFVSGAAAFESFYYASFALASTMKPDRFKILLPADRRKIGPRKTSKKFVKYYPCESLSVFLDLTYRSYEFSEWMKVRNVLVHRLLPARDFYEIDGENHPTILQEVELEITLETTRLKLAWLTDTLVYGCKVLSCFASNNLSNAIE